MFMFKKSLDIPSKAEALPGRPSPIRTASNHFVNGHPLKGPYPAGIETAIFGMRRVAFATLLRVRPGGCVPSFCSALGKHPGCHPRHLLARQRHDHAARPSSAVDAASTARP